MQQDGVPDDLDWFGREARLAAIQERLAALGGEEARALVAEADELYGRRLLAAVDRVLRLAGMTLAEVGRWDAWRRLFLDALELDDTAEPGIELAFLLGGPARDTPGPADPC
jgi:hypothetical protein